MHNQLTKKHWRRKLLLLVACFFIASPCTLVAQHDGCTEQVESHIRVDPGHPWRPPFGLGRVGPPVTAVVEVSSAVLPLREYTLVAYLNGKEIERQVLNLTGNKAPYTDRVLFKTHPSELVLFATCHFKGEPVEIAREKVPSPPAFEAAAVARPSVIINPVDLGTILVPYDWLLLGPAQKGEVEVAALTRAGDIPGARLTVWFESAPKEKASVEIKLAQGVKAQVKLPLPVATPTVDHSRLHVVINDASGKEIWQKQIETMFVPKALQLPEFGAIETKLRYDMPISVRDPNTGEHSTMPYTEGWKPELQDVVVAFPNGARFVFWRGNTYVPSWAGRYNTGMCYLWAGTGAPPEAAGADGLEPFWDKDLRYGRVKILESTASRVHVRWSYQACTIDYQVFGDTAQEDFYLYPDGFGTRVVAVKSQPTSYEPSVYGLSELMILTPAQAYPLEVLPPKPLDMLFVDGQKKEWEFPLLGLIAGRNVKPDDMLQFPDDIRKKALSTPAVYRLRLSDSEKLAAIYFTPYLTNLPPYLRPPFYDHGYLATPAYWGSHWPVGRGKSVEYVIDDHIADTPAHNCYITWDWSSRPAPMAAGNIETIDSLGRAKTMTVRQWAFLIGMTDASDQQLLDWAHSFSRPPSIEVSGALYDALGYAPERRAFRLMVESTTVTIKIKPVAKCVNPVFELQGAPKTLESVTLGSRRLTPKDYAWDGEVLWLNAEVDQPEELRLEFSKPAR